VFEAASVSKTVFAYAVMKLCEKGVMNLDTPLTRYTSERFLTGDPRLDLITARHVLSHTSGFQNWRSDDEPLKINFTPGEKYLYSGEGYNYLQTVVARLTGQSFEPYMKANLLGPFGMSSSFYVWNAAAQKHMAGPHDAKGKPFDNKKSTAESVARYGSAGALLTTPSDYAKFVIEVIDPKASDAFRLRKETIREMLQPVVKIGGPADPSWALGWAVQPKQDGNIIFHGGDNDGFHSLTVASVERRNGVVLMTNGDGGIDLISKVLSEELMKPFV
jgi:CubicO group peptidase (beta-lactamase class C family)